MNCLTIILYKCQISSIQVDSPVTIENKMGALNHNVHPNINLIIFLWILEEYVHYYMKILIIVSIEYLCTLTFYQIHLWHSLRNLFVDICNIFMLLKIVWIFFQSLVVSVIQFLHEVDKMVQLLPCQFCVLHVNFTEVLLLLCITIVCCQYVVKKQVCSIQN